MAISRSMSSICLAALLEQPGGLAPSILAKAGVAVEPLQQRIEAELARLPKVSGPSGAPDQIFVTNRLNQAAYRGRRRGPQA